ncbi:DUF2167 domain-containing protein [Sphingomonas sp. PB4P5]|uniref:DUF2167 domain-containing protein n=1 Tax=Parasphingomonas puruogangriensis TaxID=3096155 RepID=UPI002FCC2046
MRILGKAGTLAFVAAVFASTPVGAKQEAPSVPPALVQFEKGLHKQSGDVAVPGARAVLHLGQDYYFLGADEAKKVLTDVWGNPPDAVTDVLGLVLPNGKTVIDNVWGAVVTYEASGYVADDDAKTADYDKVLADVRAGEAERNEARAKAGYPASHLVGWAQPPRYDAANHALIWARDFRVDGDKADSLNYDVRLLGRNGVLSLNMVSDMGHLAEVRDAAAGFGKAAAFVPGQAYADFDPNIDKKAEYGLAGLVAAGVGVAAAKKLGFLALAPGFGKKFIVLLVLAGGAIGRWFMKLMGKKQDQDVI